MKSRVAIAAILLIFRPCTSRSVIEAEQSVVSVYTTLPTTQGTNPPLDVYHQIANNIAERITSPIYRFLGIDQNKTDDKPTKKPWDKIESLDEPEDVTKPDIPPIDNDISLPRDVEEISKEGAKKTDKKPEKLTLLPIGDKKPERITLFSSYLPVQTLNLNDTGIDDRFFDFDEDDNDEAKPRDSSLIYIFDLMGGILKLLWGAFLNFFKPTPTDDDDERS